MQKPCHICVHRKTCDEKCKEACFDGGNYFIADEELKQDELTQSEKIDKYATLYVELVDKYEKLMSKLHTLRKENEENKYQLQRALEKRIDLEKQRDAIARENKELLSKVDRLTKQREPCLCCEHRPTGGF